MAQTLNVAGPVMQWA